MANSYHCPQGSAFSFVERFEALIEAPTLDGRQKNAVRTALKDLEHLLDVYDLRTKELSRKDVLDAFSAIRQNYGV